MNNNVAPIKSKRKLRKTFVYHLNQLINKLRKEGKL